MQDYSECSTLATHESRRLRDTRDGTVYTIKKLEDGNCWMTENIRIADADISSTDSNLAEGKTWHIPESSEIGFSAEDNNSAYVHEANGGYYSFYTASGGLGSVNLRGGNVSQDICPKGWRIPTKSELDSLYNDYYNSPSLIQGEPNFYKSGFFAQGENYTNDINESDAIGRYWTTSIYDDGFAYAMIIKDDLSNENDSYGSFKSAGFSVRCLVEDRTIAGLEYMQDITKKTVANTPAGTTKTLIDTRDDKVYTIKKLADGKVWMTSDLTIQDREINGFNSNIPFGETFTVPLFYDPSWFDDDMGTPVAFVDSGTGYGYYNYLTATAGWGTTSNISGNAPKDICPYGWRLPTGNTTGEQGALLTEYTTVTALTGTPGLNLNGYGYGNINDVGVNGHYWSSTTRDANNAYQIQFDTTTVSPASSYSPKNYGSGIRCIAK
jgi:uncharacterized protein (TIGR02145 family)